MTNLSQETGTKLIELLGISRANASEWAQKVAKGNTQISKEQGERGRKDR